MSTTSLVSRLFCRRFTVAAAGLLLTAAPAAAGDWLGFRGNDGSGVTVGIVDGGMRTTHQDLISRMLPCVTAGGATLP